ncbi:hypothetical protein [Streptomyces sp. NBC_01013]|uniref:hypothetical protein n=1 Tax=Streptomyces sp. NBC_01013 TaxID=2903718 RepID=UPI0038650225|nr:hypothetical protein OG538_20635 [Streptomyces sp. NBC_01013]
MKLMLVVAVLVAGLAGYVASQWGARAPHSTTPHAVATTRAPARSATAVPSPRPTGDTPSAWCAAAPDAVTVPPPKVELLFSTATWRSCTTGVTRKGAGEGGVPYEIDATLPVFWSANPAVDALNSKIRRHVDNHVKDFLAAVDDAPSDAAQGAALTLSEQPRINQVGRLAVIQFTGQVYVGGSHEGVIDDWININTDTWTLLDKDQILLPAARQDEGATRLAELIAPKIMGTDSSCTTDAAALLAGGQMPEGTVTPGSYQKKMETGLQFGGELVVDFPPYYLFAYGCGVGSATLDLRDLVGLINPDTVALATATVAPEVAPSPFTG